MRRKVRHRGGTIGGGGLRRHVFLNVRTHICRAWIRLRSTRRWKSIAGRLSTSRTRAAKEEREQQYAQPGRTRAYDSLMTERDEPDALPPRGISITACSSVFSTHSHADQTLTLIIGSRPLQRDRTRLHAYGSTSSRPASPSSGFTALQVGRWNRPRQRTDARAAW